MSWQKYSEKHPFGKGATVITQDNIIKAQERLAAKRRLEAGRGTPEDRIMLAEAEALLDKVRNGGDDE